MTDSFAVITGASQGLGKAFACELASRRINCILLGLPNEQLQSLSDELIDKFQIKCLIYETDLVIHQNMMNFTKWVNDNFEICMLINNVGIGGSAPFGSVSSDYLYTMIQLNITATTLITHQLLPNLLKQKQSYILNVSSMIAFTPIGYKTIYPASKAFVSYFSRGLYQELIDTNVFVSVIHPGPIPTNREVIKRIKNQGYLATLGVLSAENVAKIAIRKLLHKKSMVLMNAVNTFQWLLMRIVPIWIRLPLMTKKVKEQLYLDTDY